MNSPSQIFFKDINHGYRAVILKKNSLWLVPFYMVVATYFYYEKECRMMCNCIKPPQNKLLFSFGKKYLNYIYFSDARP